MYAIGKRVVQPNNIVRALINQMITQKCATRRSNREECLHLVYPFKWVWVELNNTYGTGFAC